MNLNQMVQQATTYYDATELCDEIQKITPSITVVPNLTAFKENPEKAMKELRLAIDQLLAVPDIIIRESQKTPATSEIKYLKAKDAAEMLGISPQSLYRMNEANEIPKGIPLTGIGGKSNRRGTLRWVASELEQYQKEQLNQRY